MKTLTELHVVIVILVSGASLSYSKNFNWITQMASYMEPISVEVSEKCREDVKEFLFESQNLSMWAVSMMDAMGKYPSGVLSGNIRSMGSFDQCLRVQHPQEKYQGKYCLLRLHYSAYGEKEHLYERFINLVTAEREELETGDDWLQGTLILPTYSYSEWALCIPSSCTARDVKVLSIDAIERAISRSGIHISISLDESNCYVGSIRRPYELLDFLVTLILVGLCLAVIIGTVCHRRTMDIEKSKCENAKLLWKTLGSFSLFDNWGRLVNMETYPDDSITCLEGIRSLSTLWVVMTHQIILISQLPFINKLETMQTHNNYLYYALWNSYFNVDTFLLVSGLLRSYSLMRNLEKGSASYAKSALQRYLRLTPTYIFVILFYVTIYDRLDDGPAWNYYVTRNSEACRRNWWQNLLYVNNYDSGNDKCMLQSWYLSADMQLFLTAPLIVYPLWKWKYTGKIIIAIALIFSIFLPFVTTVIYKLPGTYVFSVSNSLLNEYAHRIYMATHNRMSPYLVGLCLGGILHGKRIVRLEKWKIILGWTSSLAVMYACVYGAKGITSIHHSYDLWEAAAYGGFHRFAWSISVAWIVYACHTGYAGPINAFLSCGIFKIFGKISYCVYLTHLAVLLYNSAVLQSPRQLHTYITIRDFLGDYTIIFLISLLVYLLVESPLSHLTRYVFQKY